MKQVSKRVGYEEAKAHLAGKRQVIASFETVANDQRMPYRIMRYVFDDLTQIDFLYGSSLSSFVGWALTTYEKE